jgi:hypothetical protein
MSNESENQTTTIEKIPRKSIHFVKTLKHLTEAELGYKSLAALSKEEYQFYGYTKNTYDKPWGWGFLDRFSENWILVTPLVTKKEKNMILETHHLQS